MRHWRAGTLLAGLLAFGVLAGVGIKGARPETAHAQAGQTWNVLVGTDIEASFISTQAYFPGSLTITQGDTVNWNFASFHTVTFPAGGPPPALIEPGPGPGELMLGPGFFPIPPGPTAPSGPYDGSTPISSGTPPEGGDETDPQDAPPFVFSLTFTRAGSYHYICVLHPGMEGWLTVLPPGSAPPETPTQARARGDAELQGRVGLLNALVNEAAPNADDDQVSGSVTVHTAVAGIGVGGASKLAFMPAELDDVRVGDVVVWYWSDPYEIHTVTFPGNQPPPEFVEPRFGPGGPGAGPPTLVIPANVAGPAGNNAAYTGGYLNSGVKGVGASFAATFAAPGTYEYLCLVHPFMMGKITVSP
jgi:plastocyanin